jgi:hypothetical protein
MFPKIPPSGAPAPKQPNAISFMRPGGKVTPKIPRAVGAMAAAAKPCKPLMISKPISFGMKGGMMDVMVKKADPQRKMRRRPYTSASLPHSNYLQHQFAIVIRLKGSRTRKQPNVRLYAETIHCCLLVGISRASPMVGKIITEA